MTRENNKIKKPKSKFFKIYVGVLIFLAVLLIAALIVLNALLRDFESVQPKYLAAEMFSQYFTDDTSALVDAIKSTSGGFESEEMLRGYVDQAMSGGALSYYEVSSGVKKEWIKYVVKSGDKSIFNFTLVEQDERSSFGFKKYKFGEIQAPSGKLAVKCAVPEGYSLYLNGIQVGSDHLTGEERRISSFKYLPEGLTAPKEDVYEIKGLFCEPAVTADNGNGKAVDVNYIEEEGVYEAVLAYDEELEAEFSEYVIKAAEAYATYMQNDAGFRTAARYLDPDTELYEKTRTTATGFVWDHNGYDFAEESASEFTRFDDNTFSCRVKLLHILHMRGRDDYKEYLDVTLFIHKVGDEWLIFDRFNTN